MSVFVKMLQPHKALGDYNYSNAVSMRLKVVQDLDTENQLGCRSILFSRDPGLWDGFSLNSEHGFDSLIPAPLMCTISRETRSARIEIPELVPEVNLSLPASQSLFRLQVALGLVPDFVYDHSRQRYVPSVLKERIAPELAVTPWMPCLNISPATVLELSLPAVLAEAGFALIVSVWVCFWKPVNGSLRVVQMKDVGAAKVLAVK